MAGEATGGPAVFLPRTDLQGLIDALRGRGYRVIGPVRRDGAVVYDEVRSAAELPVGWREAQAAGSYRLEQSGEERFFDVVNGPASLKRFFFAPREKLLEVEVLEEGGRRSFHAQETLPAATPTAFLGVRACDLAGLGVQDRIFLRDRYPDSFYATRRTGAFLVVVNCTRSASTCFCTSMGTGPQAREGFDLSLTELDGGFTMRAGSQAGREVLAALDLEEAGEAREQLERDGIAACAAGMERSVETRGIRDLLYDNLEHPRWEAVAERCLSCGNCTMVCPTCFCHDERDVPSLDGSRSERVREWASCFDLAHGQVHGLNFRPRVADRYRQWLVHKMAGWIDQFGTSGCVGCGRCITWCPTGIDLTEELDALRGGPR